MKISIIMPTYNDATHIASSVQSVLDQTYTNWELLIMDDGSKDNTASIIDSINDPRIQYFKQENQGQLVALNNLCPYITGEIVLMLHSDDKLYNNSALEINLKHFENPQIDGIYGDLHQFFDSGKPDEIVPAPSKMDQSAVHKLITLLGSNIIFDHFFVRRKVFEKNVRYNYFKYYMPYWLNFSNNSVVCIKLKYTSSPWYHYRVYDQNYTNSVIGNFEVYFTRFRSILFLSDYFTVPFPHVQKELCRKYNLKPIVLNKKASNFHLAKCFKANINSMSNRTNNAHTAYFLKLAKFYSTLSNRSLTLTSKINLDYLPSEARKFHNDLTNKTLPTLTAEIIKELEIGFDYIEVNNDVERAVLEELFRFLCLRAKIKTKKP